MKRWGVGVAMALCVLSVMVGSGGAGVLPLSVPTQCPPGHTMRAHVCVVR